MSFLGRGAATPSGSVNQERVEVAIAEYAFSDNNYGRRGMLICAQT